MICVTLIGPTLADYQNQCQQVDADLVELRGEMSLQTDLPVMITRGDCSRVGATLIRSYHNYEETPHNLDEILLRLRKQGGDRFKIATMANSSIDALRMLKFVRKHEDVIGICMGEFGQSTRILSPFTFAALEEGMEGAPGQLTVRELREVYNYYEIGPETKIFGLIGDPVAQSIGKYFHNRALRDRGIDGVYIPFRVRKGESEAFLRHARELPFAGLSVTMPLKREIGGNTIVFGESLRVYDTDGPGALDAIGDVVGKRVAIYGAGGTGRAIARAAERRGAEVKLLNRQAPDDYDVLVQCTPVGMDGTSMPLESRHLIPGTTVMDVIQAETPLIQAARRAGCRVVTGKEMYVNQANRQLDLWCATL